MEINSLHPWDVTPGEARHIQEQLRHRLITVDDFRPPRTVAGVDVGFEENGQVVRAAVAVLRFPDLQPVEQAVCRVPTRFPYVPGLLSFRELPGVIGALQQLSVLPDMLLCDGQGYAHPRRLGIACHLGILLDRPTIGVGKSRLIGRYEEPGENKGDWSPLIDDDEQIGAVLRTRDGVKPLFISGGHRVGLASAIRFTLTCTTRYKLPETTRAAHRLASTAAGATL